MSKGRIIVIGAVGFLALGTIGTLAGGGAKYAPAPTPTWQQRSAEPQAHMTYSQEQAVRSAESYLRALSFSRQGLIEQLEYEGFSIADATFAVDNVEVSWNEQAALSAKSYLRTSAFSRQGLIEQLEYEGFTHSQAVYGVDAVGL